MFHKFYHKIFHVFSASESILHLRVNETLSLSLLQFFFPFPHSFHWLECTAVSPPISYAIHSFLSLTLFHSVSVQFSRETHVNSRIGGPENLEGAHEG